MLRNKLNEVVIPECVTECRNVKCSDINHKQQMDDHILNVIECIEAAAQECIPYTGDNKHKKANKKPIAGWSELVEPHKREARFWYQVWHSGGKPNSGDLYQNMRATRRIYKSAKRKCVNAEEVLKREKFIEASLNGDKSLFDELKKMRGHSNTCSSKIDGKSQPEDIADNFKDIYEKIYNRTGTSEPMEKLLGEVNEKINSSDLDEVQKVTPDLIQKILKEKIKNGKSDPEFDMTTDSLKQAPKELCEHLSIFFQAALTHGYICSTLLFCAIIPLVKDKNGKLDDSNNYRGIGLSCLILKII